MVDPLDLLVECAGFQWDEGNAEKNWIKHRVGRVECEELFFNEPLLIVSDVQHSVTETRFYALGQTDGGRRLFVVFVLRDQMIRVISARGMSQREKKEYQHAQAEEAGTQDTDV